MAADYFLKIGDIKGESTDSKHKDEIEIDSFSWGVTNEGSMGRGGGGGTGKAQFQDLHFTKQMDKASPKLMSAAASGEHIKEAVLVARKAGGKGDQIEYLIITMNDVMVSSYQSSGSAGSTSIPVDSFSLNFSKIKYEYKPQKADGSLEGGVLAMYDRAAMKHG